MKKIIFTILSLLIFSNSFASDNNLTILDVDSKNSNIIKIFVDNDIEAKDNKLDSDLKIFEDTEIENISRDLDNNKKINITLKEDLEKNTNYSLLPIVWVEWNLDFKIWDSIDWLKITWSDLDWIEEIFIKDSKHLSVIFTKTIESNEIDIKILKEYTIKSILLNSENKKEIDVLLEKQLKENKKYLLMMFSVINSSNLEYNINNYIYDFKTSKVLSKEELQKDDKIKQEQELNNVALNSAETPDTWPETWILFLLTFIFSSIIYFKKNFKTN